MIYHLRVALEVISWHQCNADCLPFPPPPVLPPVVQLWVGGQSWQGERRCSAEAGVLNSLSEVGKQKPTSYTTQESNWHSMLLRQAGKVCKKLQDVHCFPAGEIPNEWWGRGKSFSPSSLSHEIVFPVSILRSMNINKWGKTEVELFHLEKDQWYVKWLSVYLILAKRGCQMFVSLTCLSILYHQGDVPWV